MKKTYVYYDIDSITQELIDRVRVCMAKEEIEEMEKRRDDLLNSLVFASYESKVLAKDIFEKAYVIGLIEIKKTERPKNDLRCRNCGNTGVGIFGKPCNCGLRD